MKFTLYFLNYFIETLALLYPLVLSFVVFIIVVGWLVGKIEGWTRFDSIYWAFITALTVGYGDIRPTHKLSKIASVFIAITGIMFTGLIVALTLNSATLAFKDHLYIEKNMTIEELEQKGELRRQQRLNSIDRTKTVPDLIKNSPSSDEPATGS